MRTRAPAVPSIRGLLQNAGSRLETAGVDDARLEAEVLLGHALGVERARLLAMLTEPLDASTVERFEALLERRIQRVPLAYLVGHREFFGIDLIVEPGVLIPRPETELVVELVLGELRGRSSVVRVADVGTGSGAIAIAVAAHAENARVTAIDSSVEARDVASRNVRRANVEDRVVVTSGDLLEGASEFEIIAANLPYVSEAGMVLLPPEIAVHEPRQALYGGSSGVEMNLRLIGQAPAHIAPGGMLALEFGSGHSTVLREAAAKAFPDADLTVHYDLAGLERVLTVKLR